MLGGALLVQLTSKVQFQPIRIARIGVHYQTSGYLERGEYSPSLELALRIARVLEVPIEALFSLDPIPETDSATRRTT